MSKFYDKPSSDLLYQALLEVHTLEECKQFLQDLCTVSELKAMEQRMEVAMLLGPCCWTRASFTARSWSAPGPPAPPSAG